MKWLLFLLMLIYSVSNSPCQVTHLRIEKSGNGRQQIILVSGLACTNEIWNRTIDSLSADATIYSIDYYKDSSHQMTTINDISIQIITWMENIGISKPIIIGHSLGGVIALNMASKLKDNVHKLIIIDSYPAISALTNPNFVSSPNTNCGSFIDRFTSMTPDQFKQFQIGNYSRMTKDTTERTKLVEWLINYNRINYSNLLCDYLNTDLRTQIGSIMCPTLILASMPMTVIQENINHQYETLKIHSIKYSKKGLHFLMIDDFDWYLREITTFIE